MNLKENFKRIYLFNAVWAFLLIQPVVVPFFQSKGMNLSQVFVVITTFSLTLSLLDIPTGYLSDWMGRRTTLLIASGFKGVGGLVLALSSGMPGFLSAYVLIGIGNSLYSGADISLLQETNEALAPEERSAANQIFGRRFYYSQMGVTLAAICGGLIGAVSLHWTVWLNSFFAWIPLFIAWGLVDAPRKRLEKRDHWGNFKFVLSELWGSSVASRMYCMAAILFGAIPIVSTFALQNLLASKGVSLLHFGYLAAILGLISALTSKNVTAIELRLGRQWSFVLLLLLTPMALFGCSLDSLGWILLGAAGLEWVRGFGLAMFSQRINASLSSSGRATGNSVISFGTRLVVAGLGPVMGRFTDQFGLSNTYLILGGFYAVIGVVFMLLVHQYGRKRES